MVRTVEFIFMRTATTVNIGYLWLTSSELSAKNFVDIVNLYATEAVNKSSADELFDKVIEDPTADAIEVCV